MDLQDIINKLNLKPHPEGGYYSETYRSFHSAIYQDTLFKGETRNYATGIYFLLTDDNFSAWHRIKSDEMWHYYYGTAPLLVHELNRNGNYIVTEISNGVSNVFNPQYVVKAGHWFASEIKERKGFALVGCTVSPGFDFSDFELAERNKLLTQYPQHKFIIESLTR